MKNVKEATPELVLSSEGVRIARQDEIIQFAKREILKRYQSSLSGLFDIKVECFGEFHGYSISLDKHKKDVLGFFQFGIEHDGLSEDNIFAEVLNQDVLEKISEDRWVLILNQTGFASYLTEQSLDSNMANIHEFIERVIVGSKDAIPNFKKIVSGMRLRQSVLESYMAYAGKQNVDQLDRLDQWVESTLGELVVGKYLTQDEIDFVDWLYEEMCLSGSDNLNIFRGVDEEILDFPNLAEFDAGYLGEHLNNLLDFFDLADSEGLIGNILFEDELAFAQSTVISFDEDDRRRYTDYQLVNAISASKENIFIITNDDLSVALPKLNGEDVEILADFEGFILFLEEN